MLTDAAWRPRAAALGPGRLWAYPDAGSGLARSRSLALSASIAWERRAVKPTSASTWAAFLLLALIWGANFIFVQWAAEHITPLQITLLRVVLGFLPILALGLATGALAWGHARHLHHFAVMALIATALYYLAFAKGTVLLLSSVAGMLSGAIPLFTFLAAWAFLRAEPLNARSAAGTLLGFGGILLIARPWAGTGAGVGAGAGAGLAVGGTNVAGVLYMLAGSLSLGASFVYARRFVSPLGLSSVALATYQMGLAAVILAAVTPLGGIGAVFGDARAALGLIVGLGLAGTGLAYVLYYLLVQRMGAVRASAVTYLPPVVALLIGVAAGEPVAGLDLVAMAAILAGVGVVQSARSATPASPPRAA